MRKDHMRRLNLDKKTIARLGNPVMLRVFGGAQGDIDPLALASTRPQCDSVKPLTANVTTIPIVNTTATH